jgi:hypothetical protein
MDWSPTRKQGSISMALHKTLACAAGSNPLEDGIYSSSHPPLKPARSRPRRKYGLFLITRQMSSLR